MMYLHSQNSYPDPFSSSTMNANTAFYQNTSPINSLTPPATTVQCSSPDLEESYRDEGEVYTNFSYFSNHFASEDTDNWDTPVLPDMTENSEGDSGFIGDDSDGVIKEDILVQNHHESSQLINNNPTMNINSASLHDDQRWGVIFDDWISCMGYLLPQGQGSTDAEPNFNIQSLSWSNDFAADIIKHSKQKQWEYQCPHCWITVEGGFKRFQEHVRKIHQLKCICGEEFTSAEVLEEHIRRDNEAATYIQESTSSKSPKHAVVKVRRKGRKAPFECDFCDELFTNRALATRHRKQEHLNGVVGRRYISGRGNPCSNHVSPVLPARKKKSRETIVKVPELLAEVEDYKPFEGFDPSVSFGGNKVTSAIPVPVPVVEFANTNKLAAATVNPKSLDWNQNRVSVPKRFLCLVCGQNYVCKKSCQAHLKLKHPEIQTSSYEHCIEDRIKREVPVPRVLKAKKRQSRPPSTVTTAAACSSTNRAENVVNGHRVERKMKDCGGEMVEFKPPCFSNSIPPEVIIHNEIPHLGFQVDVPVPIRKTHSQSSLPSYSSWAPKINRRKTAHQQFHQEMPESLRYFPESLICHSSSRVENGA